MFQKTSRKVCRISIISATLMVTFALASFVGVDLAYADEGDNPARETHGDQLDERLEACLDRLNEWYEVQDANIGRAKSAIERIEDALARATEYGLDTSAIEALMPDLYAAVDQAEAYHARAEQILSEHAGYNGGGKVKDREQALETCKSGREALGSARDSLLRAREIVREIMFLVKDMRENYVRPAGMIS
jgi:hypothetical protein